jgi:isopenicillin N synthase-like dioxygenase
LRSALLGSSLQPTVHHPAIRRPTITAATSPPTGYFLLRHDIAKTPKNLAKQEIQEARHFFLHDRDRKLSVRVEHHRTLRGYYDFKYVTNNNGNSKTTTCYCENLRLGALYSYQEFGANWPAYERLKGVNPVTQFQSSLKYISDQYTIELRRISEQLREAFTMALGLPPNEFDHFITPKPHWFLTLSKYHPSPPPSTPSFRQPSFASINQFVDTNLFSLTLQDGITAGLQIQSRACCHDDDDDAEEVTWLDVGKIHPDYLICNVGKQMEVLSNGYFSSNPYRVMVPGMRSLLTVSFGYNPSLETTIPAIPLQLQENSIQKDPTRLYASRDPLQVGDFLFWNLAKMHPAAFRGRNPDLELLEDGRICQKDKSLHGTMM